MHEKPHIPQLTGIRAAAAWGIYVYHVNPLGRGAGGGFWQRVGNELHVSLMCFYVLSGFLIYYNYGQRVTHLTAGRYAQYLRNRWVRIFPLYLLLLGLTYGVYGLPTPRYLLAIHATLTQGLSPRYLATGLPQAWTLTVEEMFYLTAPMIFWAARRWTVLAPWGVLVVLGAVLGVVSGEFGFVFGRTLCGTIYCFVVGIQLAMWFLERLGRQGGLSAEEARRRARGAADGWPLWTYGGLAGMAAAVVAMSRLSGPGVPDASHHPLGAVLMLYAVPSGVGAMFWGLLTETSWLARLLASRAAVLLGASSYAFYLIHLGVFQNGLRMLLGQSWLMGFALVNGLAIVLHLGIEKPLHLGLRSHAGRADGQQAGDGRWPQVWTLQSRLAVAALVLLAVAGPAVDFVWQRTRGARPWSSFLWTLRAEQRLATGRGEEALADCGRAIEHWPAYAEPYLLRAKWQLSQQEISAARADLERAVALRPAAAQGEYLLGLAYWAQADRTRAGEHLRRALAADPASSDARYQLGKLEWERGRPTEAVALLSALPATRRQEPEVELLLARAWTDSGAGDRAIALYRRVLAAAPRTAEAAGELAWLLAVRPQASEADGREGVRWAQRACELTRFEEPVWIDVLAAAHARAGDFGEAVATERRALEVARGADGAVGRGERAEPSTAAELAAWEARGSGYARREVYTETPVRRRVRRDAVAAEK